MNQQLSAGDLAVIERAHPVDEPFVLTEPKPPMTRREKLTMWADLVGGRLSRLQLFSNLEHWQPVHLDDPRYAARDVTAIGVAVAHPPFQAEGIGRTVGSVIKYFDLTRDELHAFSCDCGGSIGNAEQAQRIRALAHQRG